MITHQFRQTSQLDAHTTLWQNKQLTLPEKCLPLDMCTHMFLGELAVFEKERKCDQIDNLH